MREEMVQYSSLSLLFWKVTSSGKTEMGRAIDDGENWLQNKSAVKEKKAEILIEVYLLSVSVSVCTLCKKYCNSLQSVLHCSVPHLISVPSCMGCAILRNYHCSPLMGASNKGFTN
jgi:hypothetical protein